MPVVTSYGYPGGVGDRRALIVADAAPAFDLDKLVDGDLSSSGSETFLSWAAGSRIEFDFANLGPRIIDEFSLYKNSLSFGTFKFQAYDEDLYQWVDLSGVIDASGSDEKIVAAFFNETPYLRYGILHVTDATGATVHEIDFKLSALCPPHARTSYAFAGGVGDRQSVIAISTTAALGGAADVEMLINGIVSFDNFWFIAGQADRIIEFDFATIGPQQITAFTWWQSSATTHGDWVFEAFDVDLYQWVELVAAFALGSSARQDVAVANESYYEKYRLRQVSGVTSSGPFLTEIEFEIGGLEAQDAPTAFSYANQGGSGDRTALIAVTADFAPFLGSVANLVDGAFGADLFDAFAANPADVGHEIVFDLTAIGAQVISEFRFFRNDADDDWGVWVFQGSQDGDYWDTLGEEVTLGATSRRYHEVCNQSAYNYYRLLHVSGTLTGNPWLIEIEFRIGGEVASDNLLPHRVENISTFGTLTISDASDILVPQRVTNASVFSTLVLVEGARSYVNMTIISS